MEKQNVYAIKSSLPTQNGFLLYELLISLIMLSVLFYSTSMILHNLTRTNEFQSSGQVMVFEHFKNRVERDLVTASSVGITDDELSYTLNGSTYRYYLIGDSFVQRMNYSFSTLFKSIKSTYMKEQDQIIRMTFTTNSGFSYEVLILYAS